MTKQEAANLFGGAHADLARALDMTRGGISQWDDVLTEAQTDRVLGAAIRLGKEIPLHFMRSANNEQEERAA
jgi:hypothetical protein